MNRDLFRKFPKIKTKTQLNLNTIINSNLFFSDQARIKIALKKDRAIARNYLVDRVEPTIMLKKIKQKKPNRDIQLDSGEKEKSEINEEENKKAKTNEEKAADEMMNAIKNLNIKTEKVLKNYLKVNKENNLFSDVYKLYKENQTKKNEKKNKKSSSSVNFDSNIQNEEKKDVKLNNLFKLNPLMFGNSNDVFFYYIFENKGEIEPNKEKAIKYLYKTQNFINYCNVNNNKKFEDVYKEVAKTKSKFMTNFTKAAQQEIRNQKEEKMMKILKGINEDEIMIKKTRNTLSALEMNENYFEDPILFQSKPTTPKNLKYNSFDNLTSTNYLKRKTKKNYTQNKKISINSRNEINLKTSHKTSYNPKTLKTSATLKSYKSEIPFRKTKNLISFINKEINFKSPQCIQQSKIKLNNKNSNSRKINLKLNEYGVNSIYNTEISMNPENKNVRSCSNDDVDYILGIDNKNINKNFKTLNSSNEDIVIENLYENIKDKKFNLAKININSLYNYINKKNINTDKYHQYLNLINSIKERTNKFNVEKDIKNIMTYKIPMSKFKALEKVNSVDNKINKLEKMYSNNIISFESGNKYKNYDE